MKLTLISPRLKTYGFYALQKYPFTFKGVSNLKSKGAKIRRSFRGNIFLNPEPVRKFNNAHCKITISHMFFGGS